MSASLPAHLVSIARDPRTSRTSCDITHFSVTISTPFDWFLFPPVDFQCFACEARREVLAISFPKPFLDISDAYYYDHHLIIDSAIQFHTFECERKVYMDSVCSSLLLPLPRSFPRLTNHKPAMKFLSALTLAAAAIPQVLGHYRFLSVCISSTLSGPLFTWSLDLSSRPQLRPLF
jgi:hypothetical protein